MSVLVKGMEMPKSCAICGFKDGCEFSVPLTERPFDCPLVEIPPHSDLIDINALKLEILNVDYVNKHDYLKGVLNAINNAQIVIPADKDGET